MEKLRNIFVAEIVRLHGAPVSIVSDRDSRFTSKFWTSLQKALGTKLNFSTAFYLQADGHYQASIEMAPYEALYGGKCRTPVCWDEVGERKLFGLELVRNTNEKIQLIRDRLRQPKTDKRAMQISISPWKGILRFGKCGKLSPCYIGPYEIVERIGPLVYRLALPPELSRIHNVFHVSMLQKYMYDPSHVLSRQPIELKEDLTFEEEPLEILEQKHQVLRSKTISLVKVLWRNHKREEATWECEDLM
ncbi:uncharacterized protein LOC127902209 [Citrus sinensis]|uniref:uncharacterized protein LOC127902209 n=1 Tax=Citrus sinensis TaxID=2711 RepID=UPI002277F983|nr:uncharacterized protein LOC127902209 [Citrus sinensis]